MADAQVASIPIHAGRLVRLREVGRNEYWLQDWLSADLTRLGLGPLRLVEQEQTRASGGHLDILAAAGDTYYSIEVAPLWPRQDGALVYLPDPDQSRGEESPAYAHFHGLLAEHGFALNWTINYNAGANPISIRLRRPDLKQPDVQAFLEATYRAVLPGAANWSEIADDADPGSEQASEASTLLMGTAHDTS